MGDMLLPKVSMENVVQAKQHSPRKCLDLLRDSRAVLGKIINFLAALTPILLEAAEAPTASRRPNSEQRDQQRAGPTAEGATESRSPNSKQKPQQRAECPTASRSPNRE